MDVWDDEHKVVLHSILDLPDPPNLSSTITCCNNGINLHLSDSNQAKVELENIN